jgi:hypothetical protein
MPAWLVGGARQRRRRFCASGLGRDQGRSRCLMALSNRWKTGSDFAIGLISSHRRAGNKTQNGSASLQTIVLPGTRQRRKRTCRRPGNKTPERCTPNDRMRCRIGDRSRLRLSLLARAATRPELAPSAEGPREREPVWRNRIATNPMRSSCGLLISPGLPRAIVTSGGTRLDKSRVGTILRIRRNPTLSFARLRMFHRLPGARMSHFRPRGV